VILGDIVASSRVKDLRRARDARLRRASDRHGSQGLVASPYAITAGDEFQGLARQLSDIPRIVFDLRATFYPLKLWIAVGFGRVRSLPGPGEAVNVAGLGEAFELARTAMSELKASRGKKYRVSTAFRSADDELDLLVNLVYRLHDTLLRGITPRQWQTIRAYEETGRLEDTAAELGIDESTVSRNLRRGFYWQLRDATESLATVLNAHSARLHR
jgi:hypothetical protein